MTEEDRLPALTGTQKQVAYAEKVRAAVLAGLEKALTEPETLKRVTATEVLGDRAQSVPSLAALADMRSEWLRLRRELRAAGQNEEADALNERVYENMREWARNAICATRCWIMTQTDAGEILDELATKNPLGVAASRVTT